ncbi:hypothetical protein J4210_06605 [Candidatus Woesearchaeota archaeon]|nr:hypothetical protein [Candidatus Woesearchaeota archaeon]
MKRVYYSSSPVQGGDEFRLSFVGADWDDVATRLSTVMSVSYKRYHRQGRYSDRKEVYSLDPDGENECAAISYDGGKIDIHAVLPECGSPVFNGHLARQGEISPETDRSIETHVLNQEENFYRRLDEEKSRSLHRSPGCVTGEPKRNCVRGLFDDDW